jgi:endonuclease III
MILVACILLNCTTRKQVEKVLPEFMKRWPTPQSFLLSTDDDVATLCKPLGFSTRRTKSLKEMTKKYVTNEWKHARELPGIGEYGARSWEIFCEGIIGDERPKDHALVQYWDYCRLQLTHNA